MFNGSICYVLYYADTAFLLQWGNILPMFILISMFLFFFVEGEYRVCSPDHSQISDSESQQGQVENRASGVSSLSLFWICPSFIRRRANGSKVDFPKVG